MSLDVEKLYRRYGDMVLGRCRSLLGNDAEAQEAMQEVFLRLHRYQDSFRGDASPTTYLFKVTTTTCLNRMRTKRRRPEELFDVPPPIQVEDTMLTATATRDLLRQVMNLADAGTQQAIIYHYVDGMTHREVGEVLGISAAAVRKRISTFRNKLKNNPPPWLKEVDW
jgi:RNA polymerase sigma-70 factor (ECF subfamily)